MQHLARRCLPRWPAAPTYRSPTGACLSTRTPAQHIIYQTLVVHQHRRTTDNTPFPPRSSNS